MIRNTAGWVWDAWMTGLDVLLAGLAVTGAVAWQLHWLAAVAGMWSVLALRQGWLALREFRRGGGRVR